MSSKIKVFMISGLGADSRAFKQLNLDFIDSVEYIEWISPFRNEPLKSYCKRLIQKFNIDEHSIIIGLSFGGIVGVEISKQVNVLKTILISSVRNKYDLPVLLRILGKTGLAKLIPKKSLGQSNSFVEKRFGVSNSSEKQLLKNVLNKTDTDLAKWAVNRLVRWNETGKNENILRIHGNLDQMIPLKNQADYIIEKGTHLMIVQRAGEISEILNKEIKSLISTIFL